MKVLCKLQDIMNVKNITLYKLAKKTGITYPTLLRYRDNKTKSFNADILEKLCQELHCDICDLLVLDKGLLDGIE